MLYRIFALALVQDRLTTVTCLLIRRVSLLVLLKIQRQRSRGVLVLFRLYGEISGGLRTHNIDLGYDTNRNLDLPLPKSE